MTGRDDMDAWEREADFHDTLAEGLRPEAMPPTPPHPWMAALLRRAGDLRGRRVLELGCGTGDLTLHLLAAGAQVTAVDISPRMVEVARKRAAHFIPAAEPHFMTVPAEASGLPPAGFDLVVGIWVLHHLDVTRSAQEIARLLKPGGLGLFVENSGLNPLLTFARSHLAGRFGTARYGTADEHPLVERDFRRMRDHFKRLDLEFPAFYFFRLFDRQVLRHRFRTLSRAAHALDGFVDRAIPPLHRYGFYLLLVLRS